MASLPKGMGRPSLGVKALLSRIGGGAYQATFDTNMGTAEQKQEEEAVARFAEGRSSQEKGIRGREQEGEGRTARIRPLPHSKMAPGAEGSTEPQTVKNASRDLLVPHILNKRIDMDPWDLQQDYDVDDRDGMGSRDPQNLQRWLREEQRTYLDMDILAHQGDEAIGGEAQPQVDAR
eukprot:c29804_g1_i1 orf=60-590(+)